MSRYVQTFEGFLSNALPYYALHDEQTGCYMATGLNNRSREEVIDDGIEFFLTDWQDDEVSEEDVRNWDYGQKEDYLKMNDVFIEEQFEPFPENSDDE